MKNTANRCYMFVVMELNESVDINVYGLVHCIPLTFAKGMIGAIPVFDTREDAEKYSEGKYKIYELGKVEKD